MKTSDKLKIENSQRRQKLATLSEVAEPTEAPADGNRNRDPRIQGYGNPHPGGHHCRGCRPEKAGR